MTELAQKAFGCHSSERDEFGTGSDDVRTLLCEHEPLGPANDTDDEELTKSEEDLFEKSAIDMGLSDMRR